MKKKKKNNIYLSFYLNKLVLKEGRQSKADHLLNKFYLVLIKKLRKNPIIILEDAVENIMPVFLLNTKKIGKKVIVKPFFILSSFSRRLLGLKWLVEAAVKKPGPFLENFIKEVLDAFDNKGVVKKKQQDLNSIVLKNRSSLRYRW